MRTCTILTSGRELPISHRQTVSGWETYDTSTSPAAASWRLHLPGRLCGRTFPFVPCFLAFEKGFELRIACISAHSDVSHGWMTLAGEKKKLFLHVFPSWLSAFSASVCFLHHIKGDSEGFISRSCQLRLEKETWFRALIFLQLCHIWPEVHPQYFLFLPLFSLDDICFH